MRRGRRIGAGIIVCILLVGMLGSCGNSSKSLRDRKTLPQLIIGSDNYEPYNYIDESGRFVGVDVDIAKEACRRIGYKPVFKRIVWENKDAYLQDGTVDCLWGSFTMTGREDEYMWAGPYLYSRQVVAVRRDSDIHTLEDLADKRIAVQATSKPEMVLLQEEDARIARAGQVYSFSTMDEIFACLRKGYVDAIAGHEDALHAFVQTAPNMYNILDESLYVSELGIAFRRGSDKKRAERFTKVLKDMTADGTIRKIAEKYGLNADAALGGFE